MKSSKHQKGLSFIILVIIIGLLFGYAAFVGIKLAPEYMEYMSIRSAVNSLADEMESRVMSKNEYMDSLTKRLDVNYISTRKLVPSRDGCSKNKNDVFTYKRGKKDIELGVNYESRVPIIFNVDFLLSFSHMRSVSLKTSN